MLQAYSYDKRGAGLNQDAVINEENLSFDDFIDDAVFWLEELRADDRFERLIVIGHSQGSLVGDSRPTSRNRCLYLLSWCRKANQSSTTRAAFRST